MGVIPDCFGPNDPDPWMQPGEARQWLEFVGVPSDELEGQLYLALKCKRIEATGENRYQLGRHSIPADTWIDHRLHFCGQDEDATYHVEFSTQDGCWRRVRFRRADVLLAFPFPGNQKDAAPSLRAGNNDNKRVPTSAASLACPEEMADLTPPHHSLTEAETQAPEALCPTIQSDVERIHLPYPIYLHDIVPWLNPNLQRVRQMVRRPASRAAIFAWYTARVQEWPLDGATPSEGDDKKAAEDRFAGMSISRQWLREARGELAPESWKKPGRRKWLKINRAS